MERLRDSFMQRISIGESTSRLTKPGVEGSIELSRTQAGDTELLLTSMLRADGSTLSDDGRAALESVAKHLKGNSVTLRMTEGPEALGAVEKILTTAGARVQRDAGASEKSAVSLAVADPDAGIHLMLTIGLTGEKWSAKSQPGDTRPRETISLGVLPIGDSTDPVQCDRPSINFSWRDPDSSMHTLEIVPGKKAQSFDLYKRPHTSGEAGPRMPFGTPIKEGLTEKALTEMLAPNLASQEIRHDNGTAVSEKKIRTAIKSEFDRLETLAKEHSKRHWMKKAGCAVGLP